jgi:putative hydrolase of the HAD superfamily
MSAPAIIFDLFGTLTEDFTASLGRHSVDFVEALGVPREPFLRVWRESLNERTLGRFQSVEETIAYACNVIGATPSPAQLNDAVAIRLDQIRSILQPREDALAIIRELRARYKIGLLSNCSIEIPILWPEIELADVIDEAVFSSRERLKKPDPAFYHLICERLQVSPQECAYVADGENGELAAAAELGMRPILVRNASRDHSKEMFREAREWRGEAVGTLSELPPRLEAEVR